MLSKSDARLVAHDGALPGLALLLNEDAMAATLSTQLPHLEIEKIQSTYLRYKPNTSCLVSYDLQTDRGKTSLYAMAYRASEREKMHKKRAQFVASELLETEQLLFRNSSVVVYPFPNDRRLSQLPRLTNDAARHQVLKCMLPKSPLWWHGSFSALRYKPERRLVAMLQNCQRRALLKVYTEGTYGLASLNGHAFSSGSVLRIARQLCQSEQYCFQLLEWIEGQPLDSHLERVPPCEEIGNLIGQALVELHFQHPECIKPESADPESVNRELLADEVATLEATAQAVTKLLPQLSERVTLLLTQLIDLITESIQAGVMIHGDFSVDQIVLSPSLLTAAHGPSSRNILNRSGSCNSALYIGLLDLDRAGYGDPSQDLGSFAADLQLRVAAGQISQKAADGWVDALIHGYNRMSPDSISERRVQVQSAVRLFHRVVEPFRYRWLDWLNACEYLLTDVERTIPTVNPAAEG